MNKIRQTTYVALLRGINVGGGNRISMAELKKCFEALGYESVRTYINSGNVIFTHTGDVAEITHDIERCIENNFSLKISVIVKTKAEIVSICNKIPEKCVNDTDMRTDVIFLREEVDSKKVLSDIATNPDVDNLIYTKGAVIWNFDRKNYTKSKMHKFIGTHVYKNMTARNVNTTRKIKLLMEQSI